MKAEAQPGNVRAATFARSIAIWGPGLLVMLADTDAGNVVTAAQAGAQWGYRLLPLVLVLIPMLYMVQELTVRLGLYTGRGHSELIRERFGIGWAYVSTLGLAAAVIGSLITEITGVAGAAAAAFATGSSTASLASVGEISGGPHAGPGRDRRPGGVRRRRPWGLAGCGDCLMAGAGLGRRRSRRIPPVAGAPAV